MATLDSKLEDLFRLKDFQKNALKKLGIITAEDLLRYAPSRYSTPAEIKAIGILSPGDQATIEGKITKIDYEKTWKKRLNIAKGELVDDTGRIGLVWFHQPYIARMIAKDDLLRVQGKIGEKNGKLFISNPSFEKIGSLSFRGQRPDVLLPTYPETKGITSRWLHYHAQKLFQVIPAEAFEDPLPEEVRAQYHLPQLFSSLRAVHFPKNEKEIEGAKKRLAFEEIFAIQLARMRERLLLEEKTSIAVPVDTAQVRAFLAKLPFALTKTQQSILDSILQDIARPAPMARLLEGDVGSGKTIIAAGAAFAVSQAGLQTAYMAPTEILARQHFESFSKYIGTPYCKIGLLTSAGAFVYPSKAFAGNAAPISKTQMAKWIASGDIHIIIGTHAILSEKIIFKNLALIVVDEQHRFGIAQRKNLSKRKSRTHEQIPHFLSMTATPIPRTLALTIFGDLDLSVLDEVPPGKADITTEVLIKPKRRSWDFVRSELEKGRQAFVVCPRIELDEKALQKSVEETFKNISKDIFPEFRTAMLHGKMTPRTKEKTMKDFRDHSIDILISTSLIEVGIDIPNATIMIVEGAERFGLAQLHQLRGRIGRGEHHSYFLAVSNSTSETARKRLSALKNARNGFELAEYDLQLRGPGELTGKNQWGLSDIGMEALKNIKMVEAARTEARAILQKNRTLEHYPLLQRTLARIDASFYHFE